MKTEVILRRASGWLLTINLTMVAAALVIGGCASPKESSFNPEFGEDLATQPKYYIHDENDQHFLITVHQGTVSTRPERVLDVKTAATAVAKRNVNGSAGINGAWITSRKKTRAGCTW